MTLVRWLRSPDGRTVAAILSWWLAGANLLWCAEDLRKHYDDVARIQAARLACEARGGYYGAADGTEARCVRR